MTQKELIRVDKLRDNWRARTTKRPTQKDLDFAREFAMNHMVGELSEAVLRIVNAMEVLR